MQFSATILIIGVNPYFGLPEEILQELFRKAGKNKGYIPISRTIPNRPYQQTLVKPFKTRESIERNVQKGIDFLTEKGNFIGRNRK